MDGPLRLLFCLRTRMLSVKKVLITTGYVLNVMGLASIAGCWSCIVKTIIVGYFWHDDEEQWRGLMTSRFSVSAGTKRSPDCFRSLPALVVPSPPSPPHLRGSVTTSWSLHSTLLYGTQASDAQTYLIQQQQQQQQRETTC